MSTTQRTLGIDGMTCNHCIAAVQQALMSVHGVMAARVTLGAAQLDIESPVPAQVVSDAIHALERAGYDAATSDAAHAPANAGAEPKLHRIARR